MDIVHKLASSPTEKKRPMTILAPRMGAAQQLTIRQPNRPAQFSLLGQIWPARGRSILAVQCHGSSSDGRTRASEEQNPAALAAPANPSSFSFSPASLAAHRRRRRSERPSRRPAGDGEVEQVPHDTRPWPAPLPSLLSFLFSFSTPCSLAQERRRGGPGGRRSWPAAPMMASSAARHVAEAGSSLPSFSLTPPPPP
jgi:hypothetical protein